MNKRHRRITCLLFIICALLAGICCDDLSTDSDFLCFFDTESSSVTSVDKPSPENDVHLSYASHHRRLSKRIPRHLKNRALSCLLPTRQTLLYKSTTDFFFRRSQTLSRLSYDLITHYIQKTDGKKRILSCHHLAYAFHRSVFYTLK